VLALLHAAYPAAQLEIKLVAEYIGQTAETAADAGAALAAAAVGAVGAELPEFGLLQVGKDRKNGDSVVLRSGLAEKNGLRSGQPATVHYKGSQDYIKLKRDVDGMEMSDAFSKDDLATTGPTGGWLLHLAMCFGRPATVLGAVLAAAPSASGVVAGSDGDTPAHTAAKAGAVDILEMMTASGLDPTNTFNSTGQSVLQVAAGCDNKMSVEWARMYGTYAGSYILKAGRPDYNSATSGVHFGQEVLKEKRKVAVKVMRRKSDWEQELKARKGRCLDPAFVVEIYASHMVGCDERRRREARHGLDSDDGNSDGEWIIVMPLGDRSLHDVIMKERQAGRNVVWCCDVLRRVAQCLRHLHADHAMIHGDVKPRNICRFADDSWRLIDLDGAAQIGSEAAGRKPSESYMPPEVAQRHFLGNEAGGIELRADASCDIWMLGAVLFEMVSGVQLLPSDRSDDKLVDERSRLELLNWRAIDRRRLLQILPDCDDADAQSAARELVAWCLQAEPNKRPTIEQVLGHRFLQCAVVTNGDGSEPGVDGLAVDEPQPEPTPDILQATSIAAELVRIGFDVFDCPENWHFFLSHMQTEATDLVHTLFHMIEKNGCRAWLDMQAERIDLPGMRAGVNGSDCLLLVLTKGVLFRPYCIAEIMEAIDNDKPVVLVSEEDPRLNVRWNFDEWERCWDVTGIRNIQAEIVAKQRKLAAAAAIADQDLDDISQLTLDLKALKKQTKQSDYEWCRDQLVTVGLGARAQEAMDAVRDMVVAEKDQIIPFRRRKFENDAMLAEIFRRCMLWTGSVLSYTGTAIDAVSGNCPLACHASQNFSHDITVIWSQSGEGKKAELCAALEARGLLIADGLAPDGLVVAAHVLLILTEGTTTDPTAAAAISGALELGRDLVGVMDIGPRAGWEAGAAAAAVASGGHDLSSLFVLHELMAYRKPGWQQDALIAELMRRFGLQDTKEQ
jgi:serine/threonine protein kinase